MPLHGVVRVGVADLNELWIAARGVKLEKVKHIERNKGLNHSAVCYWNRDAFFASAQSSPPRESILAMLG